MEEKYKKYVFKLSGGNVYKKYNFGGGKEYTRDGSYSSYNDADNNYFNELIGMYCGQECIAYTETYDEVAMTWGTNPMIERKIKNIDQENKEWLVDHWIYANNFYKLNLIIILLEDLYKNTRDENIVMVALDFLIYNSCSGLIQFAKQAITKNFENIARTLREHPKLKGYLIKIKYTSENNADDFCENEDYKNTDYSKIYNGGFSILHNYYKKYSQNGGVNDVLLEKLRNDINIIRRL